MEKKKENQDPEPLIIDVIAQYDTSIDVYEKNIQKVKSNTNKKIKDILKEELLIKRKIVSNFKTLTCNVIQQISDNKGIDVMNSGEIASILTDLESRVLKLDKDLPDLIGQDGLDQIQSYEKEKSPLYDAVKKNLLAKRLESYLNKDKKFENLNYIQ